MATADTNPENNSNNQPIGTTLLVHGPVQAHSGDNDIHLLQAGSPVFLHDRIITGNDGMISLVFRDDARTQLDLGEMSDVLLDEDVFQGTASDFSEATAEVEQIQEALLVGDFDPTTDFEPAASGPAAAGPASDGGIGDDVVYGGEGDDVQVVGDSADPILVEDNATDIIIGGPGNDTADDRHPPGSPAGMIFAESSQDDIDTLIPPPDDVV